MAMPLHMSCFTHFWNVPLSCITFHRYSNCKKVKINLKTSYKIRLCIFRLILKNMDNGLRKSNNEARKLANILKKSSITVIFKWWIWAVTFRLTCTWLLFRCGIFFTLIWMGFGNGLIWGVIKNRWLTWNRIFLSSFCFNLSSRLSDVQPGVKVYVFIYSFDTLRCLHKNPKFTSCFKLIIHGIIYNLFVYIFPITFHWGYMWIRLCFLLSGAARRLNK